MVSEHLETRVLAPNFVAEVAGIALDRALSQAQVDDIIAAWTVQPVLIFPGQMLEPDALANFAARLGDFGVDPFVEPMGGHPQVIEVSRDPNESAPIFGATWHSDWSFQCEPPSGTLLHAKIVPPMGGDTWFADCHQAYETLPDQTKSELSELSAIHSAGPAYGPDGLFAKDDPSRSMSIVVSAEAEKTQTHPIVRTHPYSGRRSLFVNHVYTVGVEGMACAEARATLQALFKHMTQSEFTYRHKWQANTLVLWDNRSVVHYASGGYDGYQRTMHRTTLAGERPA